MKNKSLLIYPLQSSLTKRFLPLVFVLAMFSSSKLISQGGGSSTSYYDNNVPIGGINNAAFGYQSLNSVTGTWNTAVGTWSSLNITNGSGNSALGANTLYYSTGNYNTAIGFDAMHGSSIDNCSNNTSVGALSLIHISNGNNNNAFGFNSLRENTAGDGNCAFGINTLKNNSIGNYNIAIGGDALKGSQSGMTASENIAIGLSSMFSNSTGYNNIAIGSQSLYNNINGFNNIAIGHISLTQNTTGKYNTVLGVASLENNTSGYSNTGVGYKSLNRNTTGRYNCSMGYLSLRNNVDGNYNSAFGYNSARSNTSGIQNTAMGYQALRENETGKFNTALGAKADVVAEDLNYATAIGYGTIVNSDNKVRIGGSTVTVVEGPVNYTVSDKRFKSNISEKDVKGLDFITKLRPVVYNVETRKIADFWAKGMSDEDKVEYFEGLDFTESSAIRQSGFIAQEVEEIAKEVGYDFNGVHVPDNENDNYSLAYSQFVVPLVKGMQEQQDMIEELKKEIEELRNKNSSNNIVKPSENVGSLEQNVPNPFTKETTIGFYLMESVGSAYIAVYDLSGKEIKTMAIEERGNASIVLTTDHLSAGMYVYSIVADGNLVDSKRMIIADS